MTINQLYSFKKEIEAELIQILNYWKANTLDIKYGGFVGKINSAGKVIDKAEKGLVLNCRILWTFSAVYNFNKDEESLHLATRAYKYITHHFYDKKYGGLRWSVDYSGKALNTRNQIYGLAFAIYGLSEYYLATAEDEALQMAIKLFTMIENHSFDSQYGGYFEAFTQKWDKIEDLRLSDKDLNAPKSNNTHLHVIEGYSNLFKAWKDEMLSEKILHILSLYETNIIDSETNHCKLFFLENWQSVSSQVSFGHDIEASWLLQECATGLENNLLNKKWEEYAIKLANAASKGASPDGSLYHELDTSTGHYDTHREWWVSAEAMLGFLNVYSLTFKEEYIKNVFNIWRFTKQNLIDYRHGEWYWGVLDDGRKMLHDDKVGFWKCPYHTVRALIKISEKLDKLLEL